MATVPDAPQPEARAARAHGPETVVMHAPAVATCEATTGPVVETPFEEAASNDSRAHKAGWMANVPDALQPEAVAGQVRVDDGPETVVMHAPTVATCEVTTGLLEITQVWQARAGCAD